MLLQKFIIRNYSQFILSRTQSLKGKGRVVIPASISRFGFTPGGTLNSNFSKIYVRAKNVVCWAICSAKQDLLPVMKVKTLN